MLKQLLKENKKIKIVNNIKEGYVESLVSTKTMIDLEDKIILISYELDSALINGLHRSIKVNKKIFLIQDNKIKYEEEIKRFNNTYIEDFLNNYKLHYGFEYRKEKIKNILELNKISEIDILNFIKGISERTCLTDKNNKNKILNILIKENIIKKINNTDDKGITLFEYL